MESEMRRIMTMAIAAALLAACDSTTEPNLNPQWEAELVGEDGFEGVSGEVAAVAGATAFIVAIDVDGLAGGTYRWEVANGTCDDRGARVGDAAAYTALVPENGTASAEVTVAGTLSPTAPYHAAVWNDVDDERVDVACGDLARSN